ncbi:MAG: MATE family efflux transporter, partial [bacterium]
VSAEALGAVGIGNNIFWMIGIFGIGLLLGLDYLISTAYGAGHLRECYHTLVQGIYLSLIMAVPFTALAYLAIALLPHTGIQPAVLPAAADYLEIVSWSLLPVFLGTTLRRYLQGRNVVVPFTFALILANIVNGFANWVLVFGHLGFPALGPSGAAYATLFSMTIIFFSLLISALMVAKKESSRLDWRIFSFDKTIMQRLFKLGLPSSIHLLVEVGAFTVVTVLAGRLSPNSLAAHHIVLKIASFTFMIPLGISAAGAVRVGQAIGKNNVHAAALSGWVALVLGAGFMAFAGLILILFPQALMHGFTNASDIVTIGVSIIFIAAIFQLFDGIQVVAAGILRGSGDTKTAMVFNFIGHWFLGLPVGYYLCFNRGWDVAGLWVGLSIGLISVSIGLFVFWVRRIGRLKTSSPFQHVDARAGDSEKKPFKAIF